MSDTDQKDGWKWWAGSNDEHYSIGPCDTRDEAIDEAIHADAYSEFQDENKVWKAGLYVVEAIKDRFDLSKEFEASSFLNDAHERLSDDFAGDGDFEIHSTPEDEAILEARVRDVIAAWQTEREITFSAYLFVATRNEGYVIRDHPNHAAPKGGAA